MTARQQLAVFYMRTRLKMLASFSKKKAAEKAFEIFCTPMRRSGKPQAPLFEQAEQLSLPVDGVTIHCYRWNKGGKKKILLLHGFESSSKNFERYIEPLTAKQYEVLAFDAPAHGQSGGRQITLPGYIAVIRAVYAAFGPLQGFMAHSFGGLAVAHFLETIPHDAGTTVALIAPATETTTAIGDFFRFLHLRDTVRKEFDALIYLKSGLPPAHFSIPRALEHIRATVLWVHDKEDDITPIRDVQPAIEKHYPNVRFIITEGLGHRRIYREDAVVKAVTEFL
jgi:pimeloyl-ACP methyl ester carboxylesterase